MFVIPKSACIGALATVVIGYLDVYQRIHNLAQGDKSGWAPWMTYVAGLFGTGSDGEFDMSFERSLDRHKEKFKYYADAMALGFASWALPYAINALISALRIEFVSQEADLIIKDAQDKQFAEFQKDLKEALQVLGVQGPERDDGWVVYPVNKTVEVTVKGTDLLRLPVGIKMEMKWLVSTEELQSAVDVYVAPQSGIFNIKRGFREGGDGLEAVLTELGDDVLRYRRETPSSS